MSTYCQHEDCIHHAKWCDEHAPDVRAEHWMEKAQKWAKDMDAEIQRAIVAEARAERLAAFARSIVTHYQDEIPAWTIKEGRAALAAEPEGE